jgi:predicted RNA-binding Zn-ribbon protein involved in translation (DUF1610 family)
VALAIVVMVVFAALGLFVFAKATKAVEKTTDCEQCGTQLPVSRGLCVITCTSCGHIQSWGESTVREAKENPEHKAA